MQIMALPNPHLIYFKVKTVPDGEMQKSALLTLKKLDSTPSECKILNAKTIPFSRAFSTFPYHPRLNWISFFTIEHSPRNLQNFTRFKQRDLTK